MDIQVAEATLTNVGKINVLLGKNGSGKSTLLRKLEEGKQFLPDAGSARYVTPERGGNLFFDGGLETTMLQNPGWAEGARRANRFDNFRQMSVSEYRKLETLVLRKIEKDVELRQDLSYSFDTTLSQINELLDNVQIERGENAGFEVRSKSKAETRPPQSLSSGESELISLAIEILSFAHGADLEEGKTSYLFLDEPDAHLHPDLQGRLIRLLIDAVRDRRIVVLIATHSTAILGALNGSDEARVGFITSGQTRVEFVSVGETLQRILPIFGAHPLSNIFNQTPVLLVEGEDDERIWQQAVRSSMNKLRVWPCSAGDIQSLDEYENEVEGIAGAIYDNARAFSLRDRDEHPYEIADKPIVVRARLFCRAAENLLLSDDVLGLLNTDWGKMVQAMDYWLEKYPDHPQYSNMNNFKSGGYNRRDTDIKALRNIFMMLAGSQKPWEVAVGQAIARLLSSPPIEGEHSLTNYLGPKLVDALSLCDRRRGIFRSKYA
jgi:ABC-type multidrug transport system ATPase subunit